MPPFHGIQVYEILENGNLLNAMYTNTGLSKNGNYAIDNEIVQKKVTDNKGVEGDYCCKFFETVDSSHYAVTHYELSIKKCKGVYEFTWQNQTTKITKWKGLGLMAGTTHIAVSYIEV
ncbi:MAG: hypothetical protein AAGC65_22380 [Mucilaginibacter sp.]